MQRSSHPLSPLPVVPALTPPPHPLPRCDSKPIDLTGWMDILVRLVGRFCIDSFGSRPHWSLSRAISLLQVRMLAASLPVANAIAEELKKGGPGAPTAAARRAYQTLWPAKAKLQRDFHVFGGEFLMAQDASVLRGFFDGFFKIPLPLWAVRINECYGMSMCSLMHIIVRVGSGLTATNILRVHYVSARGAQSNRSSCEHAESAVAPRPAHDISSLHASYIAALFVAPSYTLLAAGDLAPFAILLRLCVGATVALCPLSPQARRCDSSPDGAPHASGPAGSRSLSIHSNLCWQRWRRVY